MIYTVTESASKSEAKNATNFANILFESEQNNMMIFEAALACDFHEVKGLREGTILNSELSTLQEKTAKEFMQSVWAVIKRVFEKLLNALASVMRTVGQWIIKTATPLADRFDKVYDEHKRSGVKFNFETKWIDMDKLDKDYPIGELFNNSMLKMDEYSGYKGAGNGGRAGAHDMAASLFCEYLGVAAGTVKAPAEFVAKAMEDAIKDKKITNKHDLDPMLDLLRKNDAIKSLRKQETELRREMNDVKKQLNKVDGVNADAVSIVASAYQVAINAFTNLHVKAVKFNLREANTAIHKAIIDMEGAVKESAFAICVAESEFDAEMETIPGQDEVESKYDDAVNALIDASEPDDGSKPDAE